MSPKTTSKDSADADKQEASSRGIAKLTTISEPARDTYLVFGSPQILDAEIDEVVATLRSCWIGTGPKVAAFEQAFREYVRAPHAAAVHSCTAALHLAMIVLGLPSGDEVIVPSMTFAATASGFQIARCHCRCLPNSPSAMLTTSFVL